MKKIFIILISLIGVNLAQNWTSVKETNVWVGTAVNLGVDIFTNRYGNHIEITLLFKDKTGMIMN